MLHIFGTLFLSARPHAYIVYMLLNFVLFIVFFVRNFCYIFFHFYMPHQDYKYMHLKLEPYM